MRRRAPSLALAALALAPAGCHRRPPPPQPVASYVVGPAWQGEGSWFYPAEVASYDATGIAAIDPPEPMHDRRHRITADGEAYDADALAGSHQTLQLPVIVRIENLENGRSIRLRLDDRGPAQPGRLVSLTPAAARLLGMAGSPARVRVRMDAAATAQLLRQVPSAPAPDVAAAPLGAVTERSLMPGAAAPVDTIAGAPPGLPPVTAATGLTGALPDQAPDPGQLWIDAGHFGVRRYAERVAAMTGGTVRQQGSGRASVYLVRIGPLTTFEAADAALDHALSAGVTGARIVVE